jgi:hypothetical protein
LTRAHTESAAKEDEVKEAKKRRMRKRIEDSLDKTVCWFTVISFIGIVEKRCDTARNLKCCTDIDVGWQGKE